jgi:hypothetical protein
MHRLRLIGLVEHQPTFPSREDQRQGFLQPNLELKPVFQTWDKPEVLRPSVDGIPLLIVRSSTMTHDFAPVVEARERLIPDWLRHSQRGAASVEIELSRTNMEATTIRDSRSAARSSGLERPRGRSQPSLKMHLRWQTTFTRFPPGPSSPQALVATDRFTSIPRPEWSFQRWSRTVESNRSGHRDKPVEKECAGNTNPNAGDAMRI